MIEGRQASSKAGDPGAASRRPAGRADAAADAIASVCAEGLDPVRAELSVWARGELTDEQLNELSLRLLHDRGLTAEERLPGARGPED
ncbi:MAG: hypothetical protein ACLP50_00490 [Solirubrobacteraceae bacterium]